MHSVDRTTEQMIRSVLASQLQNRRSPRFEAAVAQPGPVFDVPPDVRGFLSYDATKGPTLTGSARGAATSSAVPRRPSGPGRTTLALNCFVGSTSKVKAAALKTRAERCVVSLFAMISLENVFASSSALKFIPAVRSR